MMPVAKSRVQREAHREEAEERAERRAQRSPRQQLKLLDARLGKDQGAAKERTRLLTIIANERAKKKGKKNDS